MHFLPNSCNICDERFTVWAIPLFPTHSKTLVCWDLGWALVTQMTCVSLADWTSHTDPAIITLTFPPLCVHKQGTETESVYLYYINCKKFTNSC